MGKKYTKEEAILLKKKSFKKLNQLLESLINKTAPSADSDVDYIKKAALISKWIEQYCNYISFEEKFIPTKNISYHRGDIVFVNFGFGVGSEFGGSHYAVVLDKHSKHSASNVTVVPLSSFKEGKEIYERDVSLGNELYEKMHLKLKTNLTHLISELSSITLMLNMLENSSEETPSDIAKIKQLQSSLSAKKDSLGAEIESIKSVKAELINLKEGSIAKIEQIRTISKMRIYNPKGTSDPLYGIRFSEESMQKINEKIKELYIFDE